MKIHETAFHVINCHVPVCHAVVPSRKWTMWLFRYVIVISYKCSITSTEVAPLKIEERSCTKNLFSRKKIQTIVQFLGGWCVQKVQHRQELERSLQGRLVSQFGSRGMELSQKSQLVCWMIKHMWSLSLSPIFAGIICTSQNQTR